MAKRKREVIELPDLPQEKTMSHDHELYQHMIDLMHKARPDVCICFVCDGPNDLYIAGVTDFATAEAWRLENGGLQRALMTFAFGTIEGLDPETGEDEKEQ